MAAWLLRAGGVDGGRGSDAGLSLGTSDRRGIRFTRGFGGLLFLRNDVSPGP